MFFNPRIEAWLYKVTNTNSPEYKSELHATNGKKNGYSQLAADDTTDSESKGRDENDEEKTDAGKETSEKESKDQEQSKQEEAPIKDHKGFPGKQFACYLMSFQIDITCQGSWKFLHYNGVSLYGETRPVIVTHCGLNSEDLQVLYYRWKPHKNGNKICSGKRCEHGKGEDG